MFRKLALCGLMGLLGFCALAAGADRFMVVALGGLAALGVVGMRSRDRR
jgi:hypothetical protein